MKYKAIAFAYGDKAGKQKAQPIESGCAFFICPDNNIAMDFVE
jgi:hypothetical protein